MLDFSKYEMMDYTAKMNELFGCSILEFDDVDKLRKQLVDNGMFPEGGSHFENSNCHFYRRFRCLIHGFVGIPDNLAGRFDGIGSGFHSTFCGLDRLIGKPYGFRARVGCAICVNLIVKGSQLPEGM